VPNAEAAKAKDVTTKADTPSTAASADLLTTEVAGSAEGYRKLGEIFVSALAAIPTATLVTTLIRAPGDAGLHEWKLAVGLALAALALVLGVLLAVWLRTPVEVSRDSLEKFSMTRVFTNQPSYARLLDRIDQLDDKLATTTEKERPVVERHLAAVRGTLRNVQLLATADQLRARIARPKTRNFAGGALLAAAAAVFFLASAPKPKPAEASSAATTSVVKVTLTPAGMKKLGCPSSTFNALKVGGTDIAPSVVPLHGVNCSAGDYLTLKIAEKEGLATEVKVLQPSTP
jgi:hypothetical protein